MTPNLRPKNLEPDDTPGPVLDLNPDKLIEEVPHGVDYHKLMADEKFMHEPVTIVLQPLSVHDSEPAVPVSVNGDRVLVIPGEPTVVKRYHVAQLMKARPAYVRHAGGDVASPERTHNRMTQQSTSRYNFEIYKDTRKGLEWARELRRKYTGR